MDQKKRIVVTGMGVVSCFGNDVDTFYQSLLQGKSGIKTITEFPVDDFTTQFAGVIRDFDVGEYLDKKQARRVDRSISFAMVSGKKALENAQLTGTSLEALDKSRCGILIGSGMGGMSMFKDGVNQLRDRGAKRVNPFFIPFVITNMGGAMLAMDVGFMGPNYSISTACATANYTIHQAARHIQCGDADLMVCGGVEAPISDIGLAGFCSCKALSQRNDAPEKASRPFDKNRDGFVMGEGSGILVLETLEHAEKRGAPILAEYIGGGLSCDAHHMTEPHPDGTGIYLSIQSALKEAGISSDQIDYVNAHATSTPVGDIAEINALKRALPGNKDLVVNATKSMTGHALGAAGGLEAIATVKALQTGVVHPTLNLENPEDGIPFHLPTKAEETKPKVALSNSFGFGGHNSSLIFKAI